ncbi:MAG: YbaB/EbfC family nucleoid-associated protein [Magnetococcales bacterium]|nr:YbaB/EbfC family nucleoid-associated protein [Magnetococcales bacterium]
MKNMMNMMKRAQQMKKRMDAMQAELKTMEMDGTAGGDLVTVRVNGENEVLRVSIDPKAADDIETLEDLVTVATNDALSKIKNHVSEEMKKVTGGMNLPF